MHRNDNTLLTQHSSHLISDFQPSAHILVLLFPLRVAVWRPTYSWRLHRVTGQFLACGRILPTKSFIRILSLSNSIDFSSKTPWMTCVLQMNWSVMSDSLFDKIVTLLFTNTQSKKYIHHHFVCQEVSTTFFLILLTSIIHLWHYRFSAARIIQPLCHLRLVRLQVHMSCSSWYVHVRPL